MLIIHSPRCLDYAAEGHPENPERVRTAVAALEESDHVWLVPDPCDETDILRVHTPAHLAAVKTGRFFDADTPFFPDIYEIARLAAGGAILAAGKALTTEPAFSLMRPPGHHAERDRVMGFCYLNNIAIAVAKMVSQQRAQRAAILDFDCHHGNGTEEIFLGNERVLFASLHQSPCYPGTGLIAHGNCLNYPLPPGTGPHAFLEAVDDVLEQIRAFSPQLLAVSAGFDTYKCDPITDMALEIDTYHEIGSRIVAYTRAANVPCFAVLEGGYSKDFALCVASFVSAW